MFKPLSPYHREELRSDFDRRWDADLTPSPVVKKTPKPKVTQEEIAAMKAQVWSENPTLADTPRNHEPVDQFIKQYHCHTLEHYRIAVQGWRSPRIRRQKA
jgi:hypothetical protein